MKKKLIIAVLLSSTLLFACGKTQSPSEAAANGTAPVATQEAEAVAETEGDKAANDEDSQSEATSEIVLNADPSAISSADGVSLDDLTILANGVEIKIDDDFLPNIDAVGEATIEEGQACFDGGYDTNYYYNGDELIVYTLANSGKQLIYDIYVKGNGYSTKKGILVGTSTKADVEAAYGTVYDTVGSSIVYGIDGGKIQAQFEFNADDLLLSIDLLKK